MTELMHGVGQILLQNRAGVLDAWLAHLRDAAPAARPASSARRASSAGGRSFGGVLTRSRASATAPATTPARRPAPAVDVAASAAARIASRSSRVR